MRVGIIGIILFKISKAVFERSVQIGCGEERRQLDGEGVAGLDVRLGRQIAVRDRYREGILFPILYAVLR